MFIKLLLVLIFFFSLISCGSSGGTVNANLSVDELEAEVLNSACDEETRRDYQDEIDSSREELNEEQMRMLLVEMKNNINCS